MPFIVNWSDTAPYKKHMATKPDDPFTNDAGVPPFPLSPTMWFLGVVGISQVTEDNAPDVFARLKVYCEITGEPFTQKWENNDYTDVELEPWHIANCVGLSGNVSRMTNAEYVKHMLSIAKREKLGEFDSKAINARLKDCKQFFQIQSVQALINSKG